jgi:hypothetical protein
MVPIIMDIECSDSDTVLPFECDPFGRTDGRIVSVPLSSLLAAAVPPTPSPHCAHGPISSVHDASSIYVWIP